MMKEDIKLTMDIGAISALISYFFDMLPKIATLLTVIWMLLRVVESLQNMGYLKKRRIIYTRRDDGNVKDHDHE